MRFPTKRSFLLVALLAVITTLWYWQITPVKPSITFDPQIIGADPEAYITAQEAQFNDIRPDLQKQIIWQDPVGKGKTKLAIVYIHGFSASKAEIRPVPDMVSAALQANLYYIRLPGHARTSAAMGEPDVDAYFNALAEALAIGERIGENTIILSTSFGGTLAAWADLTGFDGAHNVKANVFISPAFELAAAGSSLLTYPLASIYTPLIVGPYRVPNPTADFDEIYAWTNAYPANALLPLAEAVKLTGALDPASAKTPAMFIYDKRDKTADENRTAEFYENWGAPKNRLLITNSVDVNHHVITGDLSNPQNNELVANAILNWLRTTLNTSPD